MNSTPRVPVGNPSFHFPLPNRVGLPETDAGPASIFIDELDASGERPARQNWLRFAKRGADSDGAGHVGGLAVSASRRTLFYETNPIRDNGGW
jgi:hypothetical protein